MSSASSLYPLLPKDCHNIRLRPDSQFTPYELQDYVENHPNSVFVNEAMDYVIISNWKARSEIAEIIEVGSSLTFPPYSRFHYDGPSWAQRRIQLLKNIQTVLQTQGRDLVIASDQEARDHLLAYRDAGFHELDHIFVYRRSHLHMPLPSYDNRLEIRALTSTTISDLLQIEHESFPWLWWFAEEEWEFIQLLADVETFLAYVDSNLIGYESHTIHSQHGHLDRLAIRPQFQNQGWGRQLLRFALYRMHQLGVTTIGLSTQADNIRAQHLYEQHQFVRQNIDARIYGCVLSPTGAYYLDRYQGTRQADREHE